VFVIWGSTDRNQPSYLSSCSKRNSR